MIIRTLYAGNYRLRPYGLWRNQMAWLSSTYQNTYYSNLDIDFECLIDTMQDLGPMWRALCIKGFALYTMIVAEANWIRQWRQGVQLATSWGGAWQAVKNNDVSGYRYSLQNFFTPVSYDDWHWASKCQWENMPYCGRPRKPCPLIKSTTLLCLFPRPCRSPGLQLSVELNGQTSSITSICHVRRVSFIFHGLVDEHVRYAAFFAFHNFLWWLFRWRVWFGFPM